MVALFLSDVFSVAQHYERCAGTLMHSRQSTRGRHHDGAQRVFAVLPPAAGQSTTRRRSWS
jgi:hypothetical protein